MQTKLTHGAELKRVFALSEGQSVMLFCKTRSAR